VAQRLYARLRPLAYVTCSSPRGRIGSPPKRGPGVYAVRSGSGHVSALDPPGSCSRPEYVLPWNLGTPLWTARTPYRGGPDPIPGVRLAHVEVLDQPWRFGLYIQGSGALLWGLDLLLMPWSISPSLDTWRLRTRPCGGVGRCCGPRVVARDWGESWPGPTYSTFTTRLRDSHVGTASLYSSKGSLVSGYRQWPSGSPQGMRACRWSQSLYFASTWHDR
jgi:hypothetical protein